MSFEYGVQTTPIYWRQDLHSSLAHEKGIKLIHGFIGKSNETMTYQPGETRPIFTSRRCRVEWKKPNIHALFWNFFCICMQGYTGSYEITMVEVYCRYFWLCKTRECVVSTGGGFIRVIRHLLRRQYAVKAPSLAPLSRFRGSLVTTAHARQCCIFQSYVKTVPSRMKLTKREPHSWEPRQRTTWHGVWQRITA